MAGRIALIRLPDVIRIKVVSMKQAYATWYEVKNCLNLGDVALYEQELEYPRDYEIHGSCHCPFRPWYAASRD